MSVLIAHPSPGVYARQTAVALVEAGLIRTFCTTFVDLRRSRTRKILGSVLSRVGVDIDRALAGRRLPDELAPFVQTRPLRELLRLAASRLTNDAVLVDRLWEEMTLDFDRWCATCVGAETKVVYGYEFNSLAMFQRAANLGVGRILEAPCAEHEFNASVLVEHGARFGGATTRYSAHVEKLRASRTRRRREELDLAEVVVVNSEFTRWTYGQAGVDVSRFRVVPLGAPDARSEVVELQTRAPLRLIFAGNFGLLKGAHLLLDALRARGVEGNVEVDVFGEATLCDTHRFDLPDSVRIIGRLPHRDLQERMPEYDALILPSLSDGFGMVVTEALANGVPCLVSRHVGAAELIQDGENGYVFDVSSKDAIIEALVRCLDDRPRLSMMRAGALLSARRRPWSVYRGEIADLIRGHVVRA